MKHLISFVQKIDPPREIKYGFDVNSAKFTPSSEGGKKLLKRLSFKSNDIEINDHIVIIKKPLRYQPLGGNRGFTAEISENKVQFELKYPSKVKIEEDGIGCYFKIENEDANKPPEKIRLTEGRYERRAWQ